VSIELVSSQRSESSKTRPVSRNLEILYVAPIGLMVLPGLRSREVLALNIEDLPVADSQIRVAGKGGKPRVLPLAPETAQLTIICTWSNDAQRTNFSVRSASHCRPVVLRPRSRFGIPRTARGFHHRRSHIGPVQS
jgi:integrase